MEGKKVKKRVKKYHWLISFAITVIVSMWIYGMVRIYFPDPIDIGFGQYLDIGVGVIIFALFISGFIIGILFKHKGKRR